MSEMNLLLEEVRTLKRRIQALETVAEHPGFAASDVARKSLTLSQFAATTSAQLAGVISDETGSGALVFATSAALLGTANVFTQGQTINSPTAGTIGLTINTAASATNYVQVWKYNGTTSGVFYSVATSDLLQVGLRRDYGNDLPGAYIIANRNNNAGATGRAAGCFGYDRAAGTLYTWADNSGNLRIHTAQPTGVSGSPTVADTAGTVVGTQTSTLASKNILGDGVSPADALSTILATPIKRFVYKSGAFSVSEFHGIIADYSPEFAMDEGRVFSPVSAFGYTVQAIKALAERITALEA